MPSRGKQYHKAWFKVFFLMQMVVTILTWALHTQIVRYDSESKIEPVSDSMFHCDEVPF